MSSIRGLGQGEPSPAQQITVSVETSLESIGSEAWNELWQLSEVPSVFARYEWAAAWWKAFGGNYSLRLYCARTNSQLVGILPTAWPFEGNDPVSLVGDDPADYAAILTDASIPGVFSALVKAACADLPRRRQLRLSELRSDSSYPREIEQLLARGDSRWLLTKTTPCPRTQLTPERLSTILKKDSLKRHTRKLGKLGTVTVRHLSHSEDIVPRLSIFFEQHIHRWASTEYPSLFNSNSNRVFYTELAKNLSESGLLLFTEVALDDAPVAFHFGFISEDDLVWYKPSFAPDLAKLSPGEVLMRELFAWAGVHQLSGFDFTRGGEAFKNRFANTERSTLTYVWFASRISARSARVLLSLRRHTRKRLPARMAIFLRRTLSALRR